MIVFFIFKYDITDKMWLILGRPYNKYMPTFIIIVPKQYAYNSIWSMFRAHTIVM